MDGQRLLNENWSYVLSLLPADLEETARATKAIVRKREVKNAADLLRLAMVYGLCGRSLRSTSTWSKTCRIGKLSDVAVLKRLKKCGDWLGLLVTRKLAERVSLPELKCRNLRLRITDATSICRPGSKGPDWKLHLNFDVATMSIDEAYLTDCHRGETFRNFTVKEEDVFLGDRIYGERGGIHHVVSQGGDVLVRINWSNVPLLDLDGQPFDILEHARTIGDTEPGDWAVVTAPSLEKGIASVAGRLVVLRKSPEAAEKERKRLLKDYRKKGRTPDERTIEAAGYIFVFTTLSKDVLSASEVMDVFRFRWQVELEFKRLKSHLGIDEINAKCDELCRTFLLTKLLTALLIEDLGRRMGAFSPWGYGRPAPGVVEPRASCFG